MYNFHRPQRPVDERGKTGPRDRHCFGSVAVMPLCCKALPWSTSVDAKSRFEIGGLILDGR